jgi:hypothetical protein
MVLALSDMFNVMKECKWQLESLVPAVQYPVQNDPFSCTMGYVIMNIRLGDVSSYLVKP